MRQRALAGEADRAPLGIVVDQLQLHLLADDPRDAAVAQQRREIVRIRTHAEVLVIEEVEVLIEEVNVLAVVVAMAENVRVERDIRRELPQQRRQLHRFLAADAHQLLDVELPRHLELAAEELRVERRVHADVSRLLEVRQKRDRLPVPPHTVFAVVV